MQYIDQSFLKQLTLPAKDSHKGANGNLTIIGGSRLFHGSALLALQVASRIVDMVYLVSVEENVRLTQELKSQLNCFIAVPYGKEVEYISQSDAVLIGPGMVRGDEDYSGTGESGDQTREKVLSLLKQFPTKQWILDAGALQTITAQDVLALGIVNPILTPHRKEFEHYFQIQCQQNYIWETGGLVSEMASIYKVTIMLKGKVDVISDGRITMFNQTGNEGMTKGGTGDVLAGLIASLAATNDPLTAAAVGAYINGMAGDELFKTVGPYFNADELAKKVPEVLWKQINNK